MITVFGSLNVDLVTRVARIPAPGETVLGPSYETLPGGKGANQALAARRAGATVRMIGAVGRDGFADIATRLLRDAGVDCAGVAIVDAPTGAAFITLDAAGENCIVVASGANLSARAAQIGDAALGAKDILLMQREVPAGEIAAAAKRARAGGCRVILNAAPSADFPPDILAAIDILIANEHEAEEIARALGWTETDVASIMRRASAEFGIAAIATLGAAGVVGFLAGASQAFAPPPVHVVDTVGAGDAFCGAFAAALDGGLDWRDAMRRGVAAGSLACTKAGAQTSLPHQIDIERLAATLR